MYKRQGQDQDAVGQLLGLVQVVRGEQDAGVVIVGEPMHQVVELAPGLRVEADGGFVQEQQFRAADDADGDVEPAPLAAGELPGPLVRVLGQADRRDQFVDVPGPGGALGGVRRVIAAQVRQEFPHPPLAVVAPGLQHDAEPGPPVLVAVGRIGAEDLHVATGAHPEALQDLDRRGLARPVRPEQRHHLAAARGEADALEDVGRAVSHPQIADVEHGIRGG